MKSGIQRTCAMKVAAIAVLLTGCAGPGYQQQGYQQQGYQQQGQQSYAPPGQRYETLYGVIDSIQVMNNTASSGPGLGAIAGAVVGGLLGNQVGGGGGRTAATLAGAVGGGLVGNNIESRNRTGTASQYQISVRLDNGQYLNVTQDNIADLGVGNRVRIDNNRVFRY